MKETCLPSFHSSEAASHCIIKGERSGEEPTPRETEEETAENLGAPRSRKSFLFVYRPGIISDANKLLKDEFSFLPASKSLNTLSL
ncbi:hypothetical protein FQA47_002303 [Oryzias melastigma]|uniref:Uncharacterized protein n=1 Tax=Oryzias melastigma TaxID=30732 RepID=A0A834BVT5_ORYME|nr:hypothetical protein FQA47_002303 [Oryzias melastigma]